jgi:hypothetical protein
VSVFQSRTNPFHPYPPRTRGTIGSRGSFLHWPRPALIGTDIKMPDLLVLVGTLGGLNLFGPIGFIVGPIVCGLFLTVCDIYGTTFRGILVPEKTARRCRTESNDTWVTCWPKPLPWLETSHAVWIQLA